MVLVVLLLIFQSTPSVGRATRKQTLWQETTAISIHALRGEGDLQGILQGDSIPKFQSTPSVGRATSQRREELRRISISIHALRGEGDRALYLACFSPKNFNPRPPWGGRHVVNPALLFVFRFQSTPSVGRATPSLVKSVIIVLFQSTPSVGRATTCGEHNVWWH